MGKMDATRISQGKLIYMKSLLHKAQPLFLIGAPRSGTTLLCKILNAHPSILMTNETAVFLQVAQIIELSKKGSKAGMTFGKTHNELWASTLAIGARTLIRQFYNQIANDEQRSDLKYWGEKHPHFDRCLDFLKQEFPSAKYVYIMRDPRDSACSIAAMNNTPIEESVKNWLNLYRRYDSFISGLEEGQVFTQKYEDLINDYEGGCNNLLDWLGLKIDPAMAKYIDEYKDIDSHKTKARKLAKSDFKSTSLQRWRKDMNEDEISSANRLLASVLKKYHYAL